MGPLLLKSNYISPVWSGNRVNIARGLPLEEPYGESFDVSAHEGLVNEIDGGPYDGLMLDSLLVDRAIEFYGDHAQEGVLQVITMSAGANLSVQVHPDETYARIHESDREKTESWYILDAEPGAYIICGSTTNSLDRIAAAALDDTVGEKYGRKVPVREGDFVLLPAGTMHALCKGVFAIEVGSMGFKTYRLSDWGRGRELHRKQALDVLDLALRPEPVHFGSYTDSDRSESCVRRGVTHKLFAVDVVDVKGTWSGELGGKYHVLSCVGGNARVEADGVSIELPYTRSALLPASAGRYRVTGDCRLLVSYRTYGGDV